MLRKLMLAYLYLYLLLIGSGVPLSAAEINVTPLRDLQVDAQQMRTAHLPLLLMVSRSDCSYCLLLKKEVIKPMLAGGRYRDKVLIRELLLDDAGMIRDFSGESVSAEALAQRYQEWLTPTVLLLDAEGKELTGRIRGISNIDYYGYYLDKAIEQAREAMPDARSVTLSTQ